jgi:hypothetical protein
MYRSLSSLFLLLSLFIFFAFRKDSQSFSSNFPDQDETCIESIFSGDLDKDKIDLEVSIAGLCSPLVVFCGYVESSPDNISSLIP